MGAHGWVAKGIRQKWSLTIKTIIIIPWHSKMIEPQNDIINLWIWSRNLIN